jgi:phage-related protein
VFEAFRLAGSIIIDAGNGISQLRNFNNAVKKTADRLKSVGSAVSSAGGAMTKFITLPVLTGIGAAIKGASDMNETISKTEVVFGSAAKEVLKWSDTTLKSIGLAKGTALDMISTYADIGSSAGFSAEETKNMSRNLVQLTGDLASFKNKKPEEVFTALTGVYTGETESLKGLGISILEVDLAEEAHRQGIKKKLKDMTRQEKIQLRYDTVLRQSKNSVGDFVRTQDSAANQMRIFTEGIKESSAKIGVLFLPYFTKAINIVNRLLDRFRNLPGPVQKIITIIGILAAGVGPLVLGIGGLITLIGGLVGAISTIGLPVAIAIAAIAPFIAVVGGVITAIGVFTYKLGIFQKAFNFIKNLFTAISLIIKGDFAKAFGILTNNLGMSQEGARGFMKKIIDARQAIAKFIEIAKNVGGLIKAIFSADKQKIIDTLVEKFGYSKKEAGEFAKKVLELKDKIIETALKIKEKFIWALGKLAVKIKDASKWVYNHRKEIAQVIEKWVKFAIKVVESAKTIWGAIKWVYKFVKGIKDGVGKVKKASEKTTRAIIDTFKALPGKALEWGKNLIKGFVNGIKKMAPDVKNAVSGIAQNAYDFLAFHSPTKEGPGKDADTWGPNMVSMFANDIINNKDKVRNAMIKLSSELNFNKKIAAEVGVSTKLNSGNNLTSKNINLNIYDPHIFQTNDAVKYIYKPFVEYLQRVGVRSF